jgi:superfamily II DNA or RNA helicase
MVSFKLNNDYVTVVGEYSKTALNAIVDECSYTVPSAEWSLKYQTGGWDGKISLFNKRTMNFPTGLLPKVVEKLKSLNITYTVENARAKPQVEKKAVVDLGPHSFRDYQEEAIKKIKEKSRGILAMCTGAGKTKTSCGIISELSVYPVVFVVPSVSLLKQTVREFNESLKPLTDDFFVGEIGGGKCEIAMGGVNVATYQTLLTAFDRKYSETKKKVVDVEADKTSLDSLMGQLKILCIDLLNSPQAKHKAIEKKIKEVKKKIEDKQKMFQNKADLRNLVSQCQLLIIDETHIAAEIIEEISVRAKNAYYKCGLSGTPQRMDNQDIRMFGATGPVIHRVTSSDLIKRGFLVKPYIYTIDIDFMDKSAPSYQETYKNAIVNNQQKNELIRDLAEEMHSQGRPTIIMVERIEHGKILEEMIENCLFVPGGDGSDDKPIPDEELDYRKYQLDRLEKNEIIMCATSWCFTGIDAPKISCIILACSIGSPNTITQQIGRGLRKAEDKSDCVIFDFKHKEKSLRTQFYSRNKVYKGESEFYIRNFKYNSSKGSYV